MGVQAHARERGLSLVETLVALALLTISIVSVLSMVALAQEVIGAGAKDLEMMALAQTGMERLRVAPYHALLSHDIDGDGVVDVTLQDVGGGQFQTSWIVHGITVTWSVCPDRQILAQSRIAMLKVTAQWTDSRGRHRTVRWAMQRANPVYGGGAS